MTERLSEHLPDFSRVTQLQAKYGVDRDTCVSIIDAASFLGVDYWNKEDPEQWAREVEKIERVFQRSHYLTYRFVSEQDKNKWVHLYNKINDIWGYVGLLDDTLTTLEDTKPITHRNSLMNNYAKNADIDVSSERYSNALSFLDKLACCGLQVAGNYILYRCIKSTREIARRNDFEAMLTNHLETSEFHCTNKVTTRICGLSLAEIMDSDNKDITPDRFLRFLVDSIMITKGRPIDNDLVENNSVPPRNLYPALSTHFVITAPIYITALQLLADAQTLDEFKPPAHPCVPELRSMAKRMAAKINARIAQVQEVFLDPSSPFFPKLRTVLQEYLGKDKTTRNLLFYFLFRGEYDYLQKMYRFLHSQSESGDDAEFFRQFSQPFKEYLDLTPAVYGVHTKEDIPAFLDETNTPPAIPTPQDIEKITTTLSTLTPQREFTIDASLIDTGALVKPDTVTVLIDKSNPRFANFEFRYQSKTGDSEIIDLFINTKHSPQVAEWFFIEDPAEIPQMYGALMNAALAALEYLKQQALQERSKQLEHKKAHTHKPVMPVKIIKGRLTAERVKVKQKTRPLIKPQSEGSITHGSQPDTDFLHGQLIITNRHKYEKQLAEFASEDRQNVDEAITAYNERGVGRFYRLRAPGPDGKPLYALRVKATARGGIRVLYTRVETEKHPTYVFEDAGYRRNIYRKL